MSLATKADHVVATHGLLCRSRARRARRREALEIFETGEFFCDELFLSLWITQAHLAMPALLADDTECKATIFANG